jgi:hypothetical protein
MVMDGLWMEQNNSGQELIVEISPLVSFDGEGLEDLVAGKTFEPPVILETEKEADREYTEFNYNSHSNGVSNGSGVSRVHILHNGIESH